MGSRSMRDKQPTLMPREASVTLQVSSGDMTLAMTVLGIFARGILLITYLILGSTESLERIDQQELMYKMSGERCPSIYHVICDDLSSRALVARIKGTSC